MRPSPYTKNEMSEILYRMDEIPVHQNRLYETQDSAIEAGTAEFTLARCPDSGFIFNASFDSCLLTYDGNYENEQSCSDYFLNHLLNISDLLDASGLLSGRVLEIGCGKGVFLEMLRNKKVDITGIDPAYTGSSEYILKDHYSAKYSHLSADLIILRHTLEHIAEPFDFLKMIASANRGKGSIYIEVPSLEWIVDHNAQEDIFYEHCNYFTAKTLSLLFKNIQIRKTFGGQYLSAIADLTSLRDHIDGQQDIEKFAFGFDKKINDSAQMIQELDSVAVWGAGAKGATFLFHTDRRRNKVTAVIDINEKKQGKFIGGTGHRIVSPDDIPHLGIKNILVMNPNYTSEIRERVSAFQVQIHNIQPG